MKIVITESNFREMEKWHYVMDSSIGGDVINGIVLFCTLAREQYNKERDTSMVVQAISKYYVTFYDDVRVTPSKNGLSYIGVTPKRTMYFGNSATYKDSVNFVRNTSLVRLDKAIKKMRKGENILYKDFEYLFYKR